MRDLRNHKERIAAVTKKIKNDKTLIDGDLILTFVDEHGTTNNLGNARIMKYLLDLPMLSRSLNGLNNPTKKKFLSYVKELKNGQYKEWTIKTKVILLKSFYRWWKKHQKTLSPEESEAITWLLEEFNYRMDKNKMDRKEIYTADEVVRMLSFASKERDRAIITILYETGIRIEELMQVQLKHITPNEHGFEIHLPVSKSSRREVYLINGSAYLQSYLSVHPEKNNREAFLILTHEPQNDGKYMPMSDTPVRIMLKKVAKKAGITKKVTPHGFRHTCATNKANLGWNEAQMNKWFGWADGSDQSKTYVNKSGIDVKRLAEENAGIVAPKKVKDDTLKSVTCNECGCINEPTNVYCKDCFHQLMKAQTYNSNESQALFDALVAIMSPEQKELVLSKLSS